VLCEASLVSGEEASCLPVPTQVEREGGRGGGGRGGGRGRTCFGIDGAAGVDVGEGD
jgi:hypothetical protein